jgi:hypothetical protein
MDPEAGPQKADPSCWTGFWFWFGLVWSGLVPILISCAVLCLGKGINSFKDRLMSEPPAGGGYAVYKGRVSSPRMAASSTFAGGCGGGRWMGPYQIR